jgi:MFS family permease
LDDYILTQIAIQLLIGPYIDRWARTKVMFLSECVRFLSFAMVLFLLIQNTLTVQALYLIAFLISIVLYDPAASALLPSIIKNKDLVKANAKIFGTVQLMRLVALPSAGVLIGFWGKVESIVLVVLLFFISLVLLTLLKEERSARYTKETWWNQFKKGIRIYKEQHILVFLGFFIAMTSFGVFATQAMYIPYVSEVLGGSSFEYGLFAASFPLGYIMGSIIVGRVKEPTRYKYLVMIGALFVGGITYILLGLTETLWIAVMIEVVAGIVMPFWNVYSTTLYQRVVPDELRGQVFSVRFILTKAATPLGILYGTFCATTFSLPFLFLSIGIAICLVSGLGMIVLNVYSIGSKQEMVSRIGNSP